jgi:hypothetical protein
MPDCAPEIRSFDELKVFVHKVLCKKENILAEQFDLHETPLLRQGVECGREYSLFGPRSIRLNAIWVRDRSLVYFYDARGERFMKVEVPLATGL